MSLNNSKNIPKHIKFIKTPHLLLFLAATSNDLHTQVKKEIHTPSQQLDIPSDKATSKSF